MILAIVLAGVAGIYCLGRNVCQFGCISHGSVVLFANAMSFSYTRVPEQNPTCELLLISYMTYTCKPFMMLPSCLHHYFNIIAFIMDAAISFCTLHCSRCWAPCKSFSRQCDRIPSTPGLRFAAFC